MKVRIAASETGEALRKYMTSVHFRESVRELGLNNCVVARPSDLLSSITAFSRLRIIRCVACSVRPFDFLYLVLLTLRTLERVEFTLDERLSENQILAFYSSVASFKSNQGFVSLQHVYVEVAGSDRIDVVSRLVSLSPNVRELHVHFLRGNFIDAAMKCWRLWQSNKHLRSFSFTSEVPSPAQLFPNRYAGFMELAALCGNVLSTRTPHDSWNCFTLNELAKPLRPGRELRPRTTSRHVQAGIATVVAIPSSIQRESTVRDAGAEDVWTDVRNLCIVLLCPFNCAHYPCANVTYRDALADFLRNFRTIHESGEYEHLTELNVNSFHCDADLDMTEVLFDAGLTTLRALSVSPCGVRREGAWQRLALVCPCLNDLDVRVYSDVLQCRFCQEDLQLTSRDAAELSVGHGGGRLTFVGVRRFVSLLFLGHCNVRELRLGGKHFVVPEQLVGALVFNERLRCLVLDYDSMKLDAVLYKNLQRLHKLRLLCLRSGAYHDTLGIRFYIQSLGSSMEHLKVLHVHYIDSLGASERLTWVRRAGTIPEQRPLGSWLPPETWLCGCVIDDAPCVICTMQTFIGLVKPKYRDVHTKF
ncbi:hypothetical protein HPB50_006474 [Hyalomma asiaticum]|uniref:Uncharacterized protein n=1 Tax=Hyalomma asiaticum TaxID=266040 RepID=A0ACB7T7B0_HYAAI|nr:hypothetical protein HPB50_006474 [Hyalomma asiaticum]